MKALGIRSPYLVSLCVWFALMIGVLAGFGLGGISGATQTVAVLVSVITLVVIGTSPYYLFVMKRLAWRSPRFGVPLVRLGKIDSIQLAGRMLESAEVGPLLYVARDGSPLIDGGDLTDHEMRLVNEVAGELKATLTEFPSS